MIEHKCTSRECGKIEVFDDMATPERPTHCTACGRAVIETWRQNPVRAAKRSLMRRAMDAVSKRVDKEVDAAVLSTPALVSAFDKQEGGAHYKDFEIQPAEFILANGLGFVEGNVIKYVCRHRAKNGAEDLRKAIHYIELLLESEYGEARNGNR